MRRLAPATPILSVAVPVSLCGFSNSVARDELSSAADELGRPGRRLLAHSLAGVVVGCELQRAWPVASAALLDLDPCSSVSGVLVSARQWLVSSSDSSIC